MDGNRTPTQRRSRRKRQRMVSDRLAGEFAHALNNVLTAVTGFGTFALQQLDATHRARADVEEVVGAAQEAAELVRHLQVLSRPATGLRTRLEVCRLVSEVEKVMRRLLGNEIELVLEAGEGSTEIEADPIDVERLLLLLVLDARDALPDGGRLTIATSSVAGDGGLLPEATGAETERGSAVRLSVVGEAATESATGAGAVEPSSGDDPMGADVAFDRSAVEEIVAGLGAKIHVVTEPGTGGTIHVDFPVAPGSDPR